MTMTADKTSNLSYKDSFYIRVRGACDQNDISGGIRRIAEDFNIIAKSSFIRHESGFFGATYTVWRVFLEGDKEDVGQVKRLILELS